MQNLVVVESPTKARTLARYLGDNYQIEASMGHVRDLPKSELGVDIEHQFEPRYIIPKGKTKIVRALAKTLTGAKTLWLATDPDREGEAIAWHLLELVKSQGARGKRKKDPSLSTSHLPLVHRVVFHEITPHAIKEAFENPREVDMRLVDAQQARRVLDRLVGYKLSPLLWKKVKSGLSAGRVQSVALRLIVEREGQIKAFKSVEYWSIEAELSTSTLSQSESVNQGNFLAVLVQLNGKKFEIKSKIEADKHTAVLQGASYSVSEVHKKEVKRHPSPPFTTSTLQQTASNRLGFTARKTMMLAQNLYEHGLITYMRTDSVTLSMVALNAAREYIGHKFGSNYLPNKARVFQTKSKLAQEAHEAVRPTDVKLSADLLKAYVGLTRDHLRLYDLIWKRMIASQMSEAVVDQTTVDVKAVVDRSSYTLRATGNVVKFNGWLSVYGITGQKSKVKSREEDVDTPPEENILPELSQGQTLKLQKLLPEQHFTEPPSRYNEASLIKKLEELGIGRPSTYAPILSTILDRFYVERLERRFVPTELGVAVVKFLTENFSDIIDYSFTAEMEDQFDEIAKGERKWQPTIEHFFTPFEKKVETTEAEAERVKIKAEVTNELCSECRKPLVVKFGRFGKFLACSGFPECKFTKAYEVKLNIKCPKCSSEVVVRRTRRGRPFYGCSNYPSCDFASWTRPKGGSPADDNREESKIPS